MKRKMIYAKLSELIRPISRDGQEKFMTGAIRRVLSSHEKYSDLKCKIVSSIGATASNLTRECKLCILFKKSIIFNETLNGQNREQKWQAPPNNALKKCLKYLKMLKMQNCLMGKNA